VSPAGAGRQVAASAFALAGFGETPRRPAA
jgi:hypothetical protein